LAESLVYRNALVYESVMVGLYGRHYPARFQAIAALIPAGSSVLELCCGPGILFGRYLKAKGVDYIGLDINSRFVARVCRQGGRGIVQDLHQGGPLPPADTVVMQASLYQFLPDAAPIVRRMRAAAREQVIIAEPVRNLSCSRFALLARLAQRHADAGLGARAFRFTRATLAAFFEALALRPRRCFAIPGGREDVYVFDPSGREDDAQPL
jgi:ubiquinone/menaquinone biosynthesis C-methylase UbiE